MASEYYRPCRELERCDELIEKYWKTQQYEKCFSGYLPLAEEGYPLAECQVGYFYLEGRGVEKDLDKAFYWTERAALHGDWDGRFNLGCFYEEGTAVPADMEKARHWYRQAALQGHELTHKKCEELGITADKK